LSSFLDKLTLSVVPLRSLIRSLSIIRVEYTWKRIWNLLMVILSMLLSGILRRPVVWGYPPILMIEPTNICNLKCPMCPGVVGKRALAKGQLDMDNYRQLIDELSDYAFQVLFWNQGEPFINKSFLEMVRVAKQKGLMTVTSTNGHFICKDENAEDIIRSGLDQIIFSMDGTNQETYEKYRIGGNYNLVIENLQRLSDTRKRLNSKTPMIELQFIIFKHNQNEIDDVTALAKKYHIDRLSLKSAMIYTVDQAEEFLDKDQQDKMYQIENNEVRRRDKLPNRCKRLWMNGVINWDGTVVPCCFDVDSDHIFENIFTNDVGFKETWRKEAFTRFRANLLKDRQQTKICRNCTEGVPEPYTKIVDIRDLK